MNKVALSAVVATVLILLLTVLAATALAGFVVPFVKNQLQKSTECLNVQSMFLFERGDNRNCYNNNLTVFISVKATGEKDSSRNVNGFDLVLDGIDSGKVIEARNGSYSLHLNMSDGTGKIKIPNVGEFYSYQYKDGNQYLEAGLKTKLINGKVCEFVSDKISLEKC